MLLESLPPVQRRLNPQVCCPRQHAFREGHDPVNVEFFEVRAVTVDLDERQFLSESIALPLVGLEVDRAREDECVV
jgi:hypothetical protein